MFFSARPEDDKDSAYQFNEESGTISLKQGMVDKMAR